MAVLDFDHLSQQQRIDLIGELCRSLDNADVTLSAAHEAELDRRLATLDDDILYGTDAEVLEGELDRRPR